LQHLNEEIGIVSKISLILLAFSPHTISTFLLVELARSGWSWLCLRLYITHVSCHLWSWGHGSL